jgi:hypothetical protein
VASPVAVAIAHRSAATDLAVGIRAVLAAPETDFIELSSDDGKARSARELA